MKNRVRFRSIPLVAAFSVCCVALAYTYTPGDAFMVPAGETITVTDADIADFNAQASVTFADAAGVLVFNTATAPTVPISGSGTIRKVSSGTWTLATAQSGFTGTWDFMDGISTVNARYALGSEDSSSNVCVRSGATLRLNSSTFRFKSRPLHLAGEGYQNNGALQVAQNTSQESSYAMRGIVLDADAKVSLTNSAFLNISYGNSGGNSKLIDLLGRRLTVSCDGGVDSNLIYLGGGAVAGPGQIVITNTVNTGRGGGLAPRGVKMVDPSVEIVMYRNTAVRVVNHSAATNYLAKLTVEGENCFLGHEHFAANIACNSDCSRDLWEGEVNLKNETSRLIVGTKNDRDSADVGKGYTFGILGPVTGPGSLEIATDLSQYDTYSYNKGRYYLACPTNSYTGETVFDGSHGATLILPCSNNIPVYAKAKSTTSITLAPSGEEYGWDGTSIARFAESITYTGTDPTRRVVVDAAALPAKAVTFDGLSDELTGDVISGIVGAPGTELTFRSPLGRPLQPQAVSNTVTLTGAATLAVTNFPVVAGRSCGGDIVIDGAKDIQLAATYPFYVSAAHGAKRVQIVNSTVTQEVNTVNFADSSTQTIKIGYRDSAGEYPGDVAVGSGAVITARVQVAEAGCSRGRVTQTGGTVAILSCFADSTDDAVLVRGGQANGYYDLVDGSLAILGVFDLNSWGANGAGVFRQRGGTFSVLRHPNTTGTSATEAWFNLARTEATRGHYMATGGTAYFSGSVLTDRGVHSRGIMTVGGDAEVLCDTSLMYGYSADARTILNLNDNGTLTCGGFLSRWTVKDYIGTDTTMGWLPHVILNANGGRLRANAGGATILGGPAITDVNSAGRPPLDRIALYGKGLVLDVADQSQKAYGLITPATGKGVAAIPWTRHEGMLVSPWVAIEGDGIGASAIVDVDPETGDATGVTVTSPGCDYTWAKATIFEGYDDVGRTNRYVTVDCTLAENDGSGGLTVEGTTGTLVLSATNTYRGATVLAGGTLQLDVNNALPVNSTIVLAGGKLDMNGKTLADGSAMPKSWAVDIDYVRTHGTVTNNWDLAFPAGATFTVLNADELTEADGKNATLLYVNGTVSGASAVHGVTDPRWKAVWCGNRLTLHYLRGIVISFR